MKEKLATRGSHIAAIGHAPHAKLPAERAIAQILSDADPKRSQYCGPPVTIHTAIGVEELWPQWWLAWLKLRIRA